MTALASYCHARSAQGRWLLRIEDVDTPRVVQGASDLILYTLENFGFEWDGEVRYQSRQFSRYEEIVQDLLHSKQLYACQCSRKYLARKNLARGPLGKIYPGFCRERKLDSTVLSLRLNLEYANTIKFKDAHYGELELNLPQQVGDIVLKRIDGVYAYHLAVVIDDHDQQVTQVVRGADLLEVSCIHLYLYQLLKFPVPDYLHIPVVKNANGSKLSKQTGATGIQTKNASLQLWQALSYLGQDFSKDWISATPSEILRQAIQQWNPLTIPGPE